MALLQWCTVTADKQQTLLEQQVLTDMEEGITWKIMTSICILWPKKIKKRLKFITFLEEYYSFFVIISSG